MKAKIEFDLSEPEDRTEHEQAVNGWKYSMVLYELDQELRRIWKYEDKNFERNVLAEELRDWLYDAIHEHGLKLD